MVRIAAAALTPGTIVVFPAHEVEILTATVRPSGRMIDTTCRYTRCDFEPERVGTEWGVSFRVGTQLEATLPPEGLPQTTGLVLLDSDDPRCWSRGDGLHEYGQCKLNVGHEEPHEDEEGYQWNL